jgi:hypothetical protein
MKAFRMAVCLGAALLLLAAAVAESVPPFSLTITTPHPEVKAGSGVRVDLTLTNNSDRVAEFQFTGSLCDYAAVEVRDSAGNLVPDTEVKSKSDCAHQEITGANGMYRLKPNESKRDTIAVSMFSDMSKPGEYSVQVMWKAPKEFDSVVVKSNTITVTVTP